jgi:protocatechuate 3,4-dioxygenase beta subunit
MKKVAGRILGVVIAFTFSLLLVAATGPLLTSTPDSSQGGRVSAAAILAAPTLVSPAGGGAVAGATVLFQWSAVAEAADYMLVVSTTDNPFDSTKWKMHTLVGNVTSYSDTGYPANGTKYYWWVWAWDSGTNYSVFSEVKANRSWFDNTPMLTGAPALVSPAGGGAAAGATVPFQWSAVAEAADYMLVVSTTDNPFDSTKWKTHTLVGNVTSYSDTGYLANGMKYYWWVWAYISGTNYSAWSEVKANQSWFSSTGIEAPGLVSPKGETAAGITVDFSWDGVEGAVDYRLLVSTSSSILDDTKYKRNVLVGNVTGYEDTGYSADGTKYFWWVWAYAADGSYSVWSEVIANGLWFRPNPGCKFYQWNPLTPNYNASAVIHEGTIDYSNLEFADFTGVSSTQPASDLYADWGESNGWDNHVDLTTLFIGDGNTNGDFLDGRIIVLGLNANLNGPGNMQGWWDLGRETDRVVVFGGIDHREVFNHPLHFRLYGSNTLWGDEVGPPATVTEIYLDGWRPYDPAEDKNGDCWCVDDVTAVLSLGGQYRYVKMVPWGVVASERDPEIDAIAIFPPYAVDLEKLVNTQDADSPPGPEVVVGSTVTFDFVVTNTGIVELTNAVVTDSVLGYIGTIPTLAVGGSQTLTATAVAAEGQYTNMGSVTSDQGARDSDAGYYFAGVAPAIVDLEKLVNGEDADSPTGPVVPIGSTVTFDFVVTNAGNVDLTNVVVTDSVMGDIGTIPTLAVGASQTLTATAVAAAGQHTNTGTVTTDQGVGDTDPGNYFGESPSAPAVDLEKLVNTQDADSAPGPLVAVGSTVAFEFVVHNTGNIDLTNVVVTDNVLGNIGTMASLAAGASQTLTKTAVAAAGQHTNTGSVTTDQGASDTDPGNYFGEASPGSIGDLVWEDLNGNGIQDSGEPGLAGVVVNLFECSDKLLASTTTDANGLYAFLSIAPGGYKVGFVTPAGYVFTLKGQGSNAANDSDANADGKTDCFTVVSGQNDVTRDAGLYRWAAIGDFVWEDANAGGVQSTGELGISGVVVNLLDCSDQIIATTTTDANGRYAFRSIPPGGYKVGFVGPVGYVFTPKGRGSSPAKDSDANADGKTDCFTVVSGQSDLTRDAGLYIRGTIDPLVWEDLDGDGVQDQGESGLYNVTVELHSCDGSLAASTTTNADGYYVFFDVLPGTYYIQFMAPEGYFFSPRGQAGDTAKDSDADADGRTDCFSLVSGGNDIVRDAGVYRQASIGDFVWEDVNRDGIQDRDEVGLCGVTVELHSGNGWLVGSTISDAGGYYKFSKLTPGSYYLKFVAPGGYRFSPTSQGGNGAIDSDAVLPVGETECFSLGSGEYGSMWDAGLGKEEKSSTRSIAALAMWGGLAALGIVLAGSGLLVWRSKVLMGDK